MITINIDPVAFRIGPLAVRWYGLMYVVAIVVGLLVVWPYAKAKGITQEFFEKVVVWSVPAGLVGARLYYDLQQPLDQYVKSPINIIAFWEGGMAFYGAIFAVVIVLLILGWRHKLTLKLLDVACIFAAVGQFFGRFGNIINGDIVGYPTKLPWGFIYANPNSFVADHTVAYQPAAVYEAISNIILFAVLWKLRNKFKPGVLFFIYVLSYSVFQIILFTWRDNTVVFWGLKQAQLTAIVVIIAAVVAFFVVRRVQQRNAAKNLANSNP
ncbi:MAG TPA: prolipoprotein diacylglyceryl transferase [Dehalococcoidales bacterium]|nr:prolipoprotein diacylglyceryl transferase [Dehalococcoidales bacterium]